MNSYYLKSILKRQVEILELQKGKTGQELETSVELQIEELNQMFSEWLKEDLINVVNDSSPR
jgi:replicative DNA helicase